MLKPLPGYIVVEPIKEETQSGGIYLPEDVNDKPSKGKVIAVGYWKFLEDDKYIKPDTYTFDDLAKTNMNIKEGDVVIFKKWTNQEVKFEGKDYLLVKFDELLAIIE